MQLCHSEDCWRDSSYFPVAIAKPHTFWHPFVQTQSSQNCPSNWWKALSLLIDLKKMQILKKILILKVIIQNRCIVWLPSYRLNMISVWHTILGSVIIDLCKQTCLCRNTWPSKRAIMYPLHACTDVCFRCPKWKKTVNNKCTEPLSIVCRLKQRPGFSVEYNVHINVTWTQFRQGHFFSCSGPLNSK